MCAKGSATHKSSEGRDERINIGASIVESEGRTDAGFDSEATQDGLGAMVPRADGDAFFVECGADDFGRMAIEYE